VIGDYGLAGEPLAGVAALIRSWEPDFILTTGDNNYPNGSSETIDENIGQYFHEFIHPYMGSYGEGADANRFFPTLGNHDWDINQAQAYLDYFTLPGNERFYDFVWGPVHFFAIDSDSREPDGVGRTSKQAEWLQEKLKSSTTPWQIVYFHHAPYSSGAYYGPMDWMHWPFKDWGVDVVFSGHEHLYERLNIAGIPFFVVGNSGYPNPYWFGPTYPGSQKRYRDNYGALVVDASETQLTLVFETQDHEIIDAYRLESPSQSGANLSETSPPVQVFPNPANYGWVPVATGFISPVGLTPANDESGQLFVIEQSGKIRILQDGQILPTPFLDIRDRVNNSNNEQGLLGLAFHPLSGDLWASDNGRDRLGDDLPPEEVNRITDGGDYGWPYCYGYRLPDPGFGTEKRCSSTVPPRVEMQAHSAPLGVAFGYGLDFPESLKNMLYVAFHGSWDRSVPTGYKLIGIPFKSGQPSGPPVDIVTGWLRGGRAWGRPVAPLAGRDGALYLSDDSAGVIYRVSRDK